MSMADLRKQGMNLDTTLPTTLILDKSEMQLTNITHNSISSLFKMWQRDYSYDDAMLQLEINSPTSVRQVLEDKDKASIFSKLPPLSHKKKRPLCTFLNFRGTRRDEEESSIPSLEDDEVSNLDDALQLHSCESNFSAQSLFELPSIDPRLKNDPKMIQYVTKFRRLVSNIKEIEKKLKSLENEKGGPPTKKRRKTI